MDGIIGKKVGMTSIFDNTGRNVACTVIEAEPNLVTQIKTEDSDGYEAIQLGFSDAKAKRVTKPMEGHFKKSGSKPKKKLVEFRDATLEVKEGDSVNIEDVFQEGDIVNAIGVTKGKGFQGVVKRHGFRGVGDATHGQHNRLRAPGAIGACATPSRVFKGMRMAGRMGGKRVKIRNLEVLRIFGEKNLILVKGAVPGHNGSYILIEK